MLSVLDVTPLQTAWDASLQALVSSLKQSLRIFAMTLVHQGSHLSTDPSVVKIQLQNSVGEIIQEPFYIRIRVSNASGFGPATHATIGMQIGTLVENITVTKDIVAKSDTNGVILLVCKDTTVETFKIGISKAPLLPSYGNYNSSISIAHF